jgi:hypothetical protein
MSANSCNVMSQVVWIDAGSSIDYNPLSYTVLYAPRDTLEGYSFINLIVFLYVKAR